MRSFHSEFRLILKKLRRTARYDAPYEVPITFRPSGTSKSWVSQAVLVNELRGAEHSNTTVVYFDAAGNRAFMISKERGVLIKGSSLKTKPTSRS
jgi:hypothetical protein